MLESDLRTALTISVVSHGHGPLLRALMADFAASPELRGVLIVVTLNLVTEPLDPGDWPSLRIIVIRNNQPRGFGANHNSAYGHCTTPWFAILNPDLRLPEANVFGRLLDAADDRPNSALLAPIVTNVDGIEEDAVRFNLTMPSLLRRRRGHRRPDTSRYSRQGERFYWLAGMFLLVRASAFKAIGGFDERFFLYCEDYDLSARLFNRGHALAQVRDVSVVHNAQRDSHRSFKHLRLHVASLIRVWRSRTFWNVWLQQRAKK